MGSRYCQTAFQRPWCKQQSLRILLWMVQAADTWYVIALPSLLKRSYLHSKFYAALAMPMQSLHAQHPTREPLQVEVLVPEFWAPSSGAIFAGERAAGTSCIWCRVHADWWRPAYHPRLLGHVVACSHQLCGLETPHK